MVVTKGDIGLHYISIFQYQHDQSHDRGEGWRRTAPGRNILQLSGWHKSHVKLFFIIRFKILWFSFKPGDNILIPCPRLQLGVDDSVFRSGSSSDTLGEHGWTSIRHCQLDTSPG